MDEWMLSEQKNSTAALQKNIICIKYQTVVKLPVFFVTLNQQCDRKRSHFVCQGVWTSLYDESADAQKPAMLQMKCLHDQAHIQMDKEVHGYS